MLTHMLEFLESVKTSKIAAVLAVVVITGQLVAVGAVATEQVQKGQQLELARKDQRQNVRRCLDLQVRQVPQAASGCPQPVVYVAHR